MCRFVAELLFFQWFCQLCVVQLHATFTGQDIDQISTTQALSCQPFLGIHRGEEERLSSS